MQYLSQEYNQYHSVGVFEGEKSKNHIYFIQIWHLDMLLTSSWRHFCHLTSNLLTKFLKSVIITTGKQSIPFFSVFWAREIQKSYLLHLNMASWRVIDVIVTSSWRHFCHLTSNLLTKFLKSEIIIIEKQIIPLFRCLWEREIPKSYLLHKEMANW